MLGAIMIAMLITTDPCGGTTTECVECHNIEPAWFDSGLPTSTPTEALPGATIALAIRVVGSCQCCDVIGGTVWARGPGGAVEILRTDYDTDACLQDPDAPVWWYVTMDMDDLDVETRTWSLTVGYEGGHLCGGSGLASPLERTYELAPIIVCPPDFDFDGEVGIVDLLHVLGKWGEPSWLDLDGSGAVDYADLLSVLTAWGVCEYPTVPIIDEDYCSALQYHECVECHDLDIRFTIDGAGYTSLPPLLPRGTEVLVQTELFGGCWCCNIETGVLMGTGPDDTSVVLHDDLGFAGCAKQGSSDPEEVSWVITLDDDLIDEEHEYWRFSVTYQGWIVCDLNPHIANPITETMYVWPLEEMH